MHSYMPTFKSLVGIQFEGVFSMNLTFIDILKILLILFSEIHREQRTVLGKKWETIEGDNNKGCTVVEKGARNSWTQKWPTGPN